MGKRKRVREVKKEKYKEEEENKHIQRQKEIKTKGGRKEKERKIIISTFGNDHCRAFRCLVCASAHTTLRHPRIIPSLPFSICIEHLCVAVGGEVACGHTVVTMWIRHQLFATTVCVAIIVLMEMTRFVE
jgi:hypothetical protein